MVKTTGRTELVSVPPPLCKPNLTHGVKLTGFNENNASTLERVTSFKKQDNNRIKIQNVIDKVKTDGLVLPTVTAVKNKLDKPIPLGYCNDQTVVEVGKDVTEFKVGDRVASNGHIADMYLCRKTPSLVFKTVTDEQAAFTSDIIYWVAGDIRLLEPKFWRDEFVL